MDISTLFAICGWAMLGFALLVIGAKDWLINRLRQQLEQVEASNELTS